MARRVRTAIFPVAGMGTRFLPATKSIPKEMLPLVDRPLIQYAIDEARAAGIKEFIFVTAKGKSALEDYFDSAPDAGAQRWRNPGRTTCWPRCATRPCRPAPSPISASRRRWGWAMRSGARAG